MFARIELHWAGHIAPHEYAMLEDPLVWPKWVPEPESPKCPNGSSMESCLLPKLADRSLAIALPLVYEAPGCLP